MPMLRGGRPAVTDAGASVALASVMTRPSMTDAPQVGSAPVGVARRDRVPDVAQLGAELAAVDVDVVGRRPVRSLGRDIPGGDRRAVVRRRMAGEGRPARTDAFEDVGIRVPDSRQPELAGVELHARRVPSAPGVAGVEELEGVEGNRRLGMIANLA